MSVVLPGQCRLREPTAPDAAAVALLVSACEFAAGNEPSRSAAEMTATWQRLQSGEPGGAWLIEAPVGIVGYAQIVNGHAEGYVNPSYRGQGLGPALLRHVEERAIAGHPPGSIVLINQWVPTGNAHARRLLETNGYRHKRTDVQMRLNFGDVQRIATWPDGVRLRRHDIHLPHRTLYELATRAFASDDAWDRWKSKFIGRPGFDLSLWLVAWAGEHPVGLLIGETSDELGWVRLLAVDPDWRRRGIGRALLRQSFQIFARRGLRGVRLGVAANNATGAFELYRQEGLRVVSRHDNYIKWQTVSE